MNVCEHCYQQAPEGKRFCSDACCECEHESTNAETGCDGFCCKARLPEGFVKCDGPCAASTHPNALRGSGTTSAWRSCPKCEGSGMLPVERATDT